MVRFVLYLASLLFSSLSLLSSAFECINDVGKPVDSWLIIKKPKGTEYFYYDSYDNIFNISPNSLNNTLSGALAYTIKQLWSSNTNYVIYNDQIPKLNTYYNDLYNELYNDLLQENSATNYGHTKGLFAFDETNDNGFWITHSIPLFPLGPKQTNEYIGLGSNAFTYAQNALCLSVSADTINNMASKFLLNKPQIYDYKLIIDENEDINKNIYKNIYKYENIKRLIDGEYSKVKSCELTYLETQKGTKFTLYAKSAEWNNDLYSECVTPSQEDTLWVESWIRGSSIGPSCPLYKYDTLDVKYLDFVIDNDDIDSKIYSSNSWSETQDHSKWAITENKNIICMGDINRMKTQYSRGGGTACFEDKTLHSIFKTATTQTNECK
jgi:deoxyribonuclease-2